MSYKNSKECREARADLVAQLKEIGDKVKADKRNFTEEETRQCDALEKQANELQEQAESYERVERIDGLALAMSRSDMVQRATPRTERANNEQRNKAYLGWFYHGSRMQKREYWQAAEACGIDVSHPFMRIDLRAGEERSNNVLSPGSAGGDVVAVDNQLMREIDIALKLAGNVRERATVVRTATGANLPWPLQDDTGNSGEQTAEAGSINDQAMTFGQNVLSSYKFDTGFVKCSYELLTDSILDLSALIGRQFGLRLGRKMNTLFTTGTGTGQPQGYITGATSGATSASSSAIAYGDLTALYHSVDPLYRDSPGCCWMFSDSVFQKLRELVDGNQRPLLQGSLEGVSRDLPPTLFGKPYFLNQAMASWATSGSPKVIAFGDFKKLIIREVNGNDSDGGFNMLRLNERFADNGLVAFLGWMRADSMLSDAGNRPLKYLTMHA